MEGTRAKTPTPTQPFSNEIFGLFIESLGEDLDTLRACSLVSSTFRHFCSPALYRDLVLDRREKVDTFIRMGERSISLQHTKSLSLTYNWFEAKPQRRKPYRVLDIISRKASLETLRLHGIRFLEEPLKTSLVSRLSGVTTLVLRDCHFGGFEDFVSFIRCFPRCESLRLHGCGWTQHTEYVRLKLGRLPAYDLSPIHLEITDTTITEWGEQFRNQGKIVGTAWLNLARLKSFTYVIGDETASEAIFEQIAGCELLEVIDVTLLYPGGHSFAITQLTPLIARIKSLTLRCFSGLIPWFSFSYNTRFPPSLTLERIRIVTPGPFTRVEDCEALDATFSDADRYPSLKEIEVYSVAQTGRKGRDTRERLCMDEYLPCLKEMGKLPAYSVGFV